MTDDIEEPAALTDVNFPNPRNESIASVEAARTHVLEQDGATREEIVEALEPEKNHRIGIHGAQAVGKLSMVEEYRHWWWANVARPGLRALPDLEKPRPSSTRWEPVDVPETENENAPASESSDGNTSDEAIESVSDVREIVADGYVFELGWRDNGGDSDDSDSDDSDDSDDVRRMMVLYDERIRPSARPIDSPAAFRFEALMLDEEYVVELPDIVSLHPVSIEQLAGPMQGNVVDAMVTAAKDDVERTSLSDTRRVLETVDSGTPDGHTALVLALLQFREREDAFFELADPLFDVLSESDTAVGGTVLSEIETHARSNPSSIEPYVSELAELSVESPYASTAANCIATVAEANPTAVLDVVPMLAEAVETDDVSTRQWVLYTFSQVAEEYPEELLPALDSMIAAIRDGDENVRTNALSAVGKITSSYPDAAEPAVDDLVGLLDDSDATVRANAVGLLADVAQEHPDVVVGHATTIAQLLTADDATTRRHASIALLEAGEANPEAIRAESDQLVAALDDESPAVRANACTLIGNADASVPFERLREMRDDDTDKNVREQAEWALERLG